jgi:hypothetical protein
MAYAVTTDERVHTLGDMMMVTGTFTDGGTEVDYSSFLSTVYAAGGHLTSLTSTGIDVNNGDIDVGDTSLTVSAVDARLHLAAGQSLYNASGNRLGVIASIGSATAITLESPGLTVAVADADLYYIRGANKPSVTLISTSMDVSIDTTNSLVIFENGNRSATSTLAFGDGRWWILGKR